MFITSQALTGPFAGYCVFSNIEKSTVQISLDSGYLVHFQGLEPWAR